MTIPISKTTIQVIKKVLKTDICSDNNIEKLKCELQSMIDHGMSPREIKEKYDIAYSDFGMFLKKTLGLQLLDLKSAAQNHVKKTGRQITDEKSAYYRDCAFNFDPYSIPEIPGYDLLLKHGMFHPVNNQEGVCRDHMMSVAYGWRNSIPAGIISHPANCQFLTNIDNIKKNDRSVLNIDELNERISNGSFTTVNNDGRSLPKTENHKKKISEANKLYMRVTNGETNLRILKTDPIPDGFRRGFVRRK